MTVLSPFDEVIRDFAQAKYLPRIKKLLVYACTHRWESNPERLAKLHLHNLIEKLMQIAPTLDQLSVYLNQVTQSLSKPAEYLLVANVIVQGLRKLYVGAASTSEFSCDPHICRQVAQVLEQDSDHLRIRKLLILICRNHWELDTSRLLAANLPDLVSELHQLTQSEENLQAVFNSIVQNTSKPVQYGAIASRILDACQILYSAQQTSQTELRLPAPGMASSSPATATDNSAWAAGSISPTRSTLNAQSSKSNRAPVTGLNAAASDAASSAPEVSPAAGSVSQSERSPAGSASEVPPSGTFSDRTPSDSHAASNAIPAFSQGELFDLRLEIMKYTVPLLAKQVLFLTLYAPAEHGSEATVTEMAMNAETWSSLKKRDLDDLIERTLKQYPTLALLAEGLHRSARLSQNQQRTMPVASAIARAVKTLMTKHRPSRLRDRSGDAADSLRSAEQTRQFASPTVSFENDSDGLDSPNNASQDIELPQPFRKSSGHTQNSFPNPLPNQESLSPPSAALSSSTLNQASSPSNQDDPAIKD